MPARKHAPAVESPSPVKGPRKMPPAPRARRVARMPATAGPHKRSLAREFELAANGAQDVEPAQENPEQEHPGAGTVAGNPPDT